MYELILASGSPHKAQEFSELLDPKLLKISPAPEKLEVEESGLTFQENALLKAQAYYKAFKCPVLADDSGLVVPELPNDLGVYSARFGGEGLSDIERAELLLKKLANSTDRSAYFVSILCYYFSPEEIYFFEGRIHGRITLECKGNQGFGYDPVFAGDKHPRGLTFAEDAMWKGEHSHRAAACREAQKFFSQGHGQA